MKTLILGGDGYLGWPTAMYLSAKGHDVSVADNFSKRQWEAELNAEPLMQISSLHDRIAAWRSLTGRKIDLHVCDLTDSGRVDQLVQQVAPDAIIHYAEQPSAPYSMIDTQHAVFTQTNNVVGTLNLLWALRRFAPACHLIKLGTMGEYGTPNIDIQEGFIEIEHKGRRDTLPFPCQPGSFYHLSKVHDSHNIRFACKVWKLTSTDLNQGVVYGMETDETLLDARLRTSFHYDDVFGTALNRFCVQAVAGIPLTVYGRGGQKRGFLNICDTLQCVELAMLNPPARGEYRVFNQFTETFTVSELADLIVRQAGALGISATVRHLTNPRVELEDHYYNPVHTKLTALGLKPRLLSDTLVSSMLTRIKASPDRINLDSVQPRFSWAASDAAQELAESL